MVQLLVQLVAAPGQVPEVLQALRLVLHPAQQARGCASARLVSQVSDDRHITYVEEWNDAGELREQFHTERFNRLLQLLETSAEPPVVEFRVVSETYGLEYMTAADPGARHDD
jgi:quinol monooxygenase YgiN